MAISTQENLTDLRLERGWSKVEAARRLALSANVWDKFERGVILADSLSSGQVERLAGGFGISAALFLVRLAQTRPQAPSVYQRRGVTRAAPAPQSFALALERSAMRKRDKRFWSAL